MGQKILIIGYEVSREWVESENFEFISIKACEDSDIKKYRRNHLYKDLERCYYQIHDEIYKIIKDLSAVGLFIFPISRFDTFFLPAYKAQISMLAYSLSSGAVYINGCIPPNTSSYIPKYEWDIRVMGLWLRRIFRKTYEYRYFSLKKYYPYKELIYINKNNMYKWSFSIDGFCFKLPLIKFGPREFEFKFHEKAFYAGICVESKVEKLCKENEKNKVVYCTLGTLSHRYVKAEKYLLALIQIFKKHKEWKLIISLGSENSRVEFNDLPNNVSVYKYVDQHKVLDKADLAIIHGGYGTIKECIYHEVPMIVSPSSYDQHGNAARVFKNEIGVMNQLLKKTFWDRVFSKDITKINEKLLECQIIQVLTDDKYKINIKELNTRISENEDLSNLIYFIVKRGMCNG